ncbi:DUF4041 domain-containing protein [Bernardetia sp. ABR2-2B]|uniref:DUF4041 domain-containing protein n=1 Tax=Bernardetia sp. ABR2-2B TaxID=3127472 RepID=UPI0030D017C3
MLEIFLLLVIVGLSIFLFLTINKKKKSDEQLKTLQSDLEKKTSELTQTKTDLEKYNGIVDLEKYQTDKKTENEELDKKASELSSQIKNLESELSELEKSLKIYQDDVNFIEYGIYEPVFDFDTSEKYKEKIKDCVNRQKTLIKAGKAAVCHREWSVGGSLAEGKKMILQAEKLAIRAFNGESDALIGKVKWNNFERFEERIKKAFNAINKLNKKNELEITEIYLEEKLVELRLTHEYQVKKQEEKEEQREIREQMREEERAKREIEKAKKDAEKEEKRYEKALEEAQQELESAHGDELSKMEAKIAALREKLEEAHKNKERALSMAQQTKAGHVYIISNIGSFGESVYKIGMTRRLEPMDRVKELGDASVPFSFDVHAMIYSENAPELENQLHRIFNERRLNRINNRKEFFNVSLNEIEEAVLEHTNADIEFTKIAEAQEYRETQVILRETLISN